MRQNLAKNSQKIFTELILGRSSRYIRAQTSGRSTMTGERETMQLIRQAVRQGRLKEPMRGGDLKRGWESPWAATSSASIASAPAVPPPASCTASPGLSG